VALLTLLALAGHAEAASSSETLLFESIGDMVSGLSFSHTIVKVPLNELDQQIQSYRKTLEKEFNYDQLKDLYAETFGNITIPANVPKFEESVFKRWMKIGAIHMGEVDRLTQRMQIIYEALPNIKSSLENDRQTTPFTPPTQIERPPEWRAHDNLRETKYEDHFKKPLKRPKRFLPLIALGLGAAGTLFGSLGMASSSKLDARVEILEENQKIATTIVDGLLNVSRLMEEEIAGLLMQNALNEKFDTSILLARLRTHSTMIEAAISKHEDLIQQLQQQQLAVNFMDEKTLRHLYQQAKSRANAFGCTLLLQKPSDLFQIKVSHFYNGQILSLVLHIPIAPEDSFMRLFKLHPFPLPLANDTFVVPNVRHDVLAVSNTNFRYTAQMSSVDLLGCLKLGKLHLCERNGVLYKNPEDSCLGALYHQKFDIAKKICTFTVEPAREYIHQLMDNWFLVHLLEPTTVPVLCSNNSHLEWHLKAGVTRQHLGAGCVADFPRHRLLSDLSILIPQDYVQFEMEWDPVSFLPDTRELLIPEFKKLERLGATTVTLSTLQSIATNRLDETPMLHKIHFGFNAIAVFTAAVLFTLCVHRYHSIHQERIRLRRERELQDAIRTAIGNNTLIFDEEGPRFTATPLPRDLRPSSSANEPLIDSKANAP